MKNRKWLYLVIAFVGLISSSRSQTKEWEANMVLTYEYVFNNNLINVIEVKKDTIHYRWNEDKKSQERLIVNGNTQKQILELMEKYEFLNFKKGKVVKSSPTSTFIYKKENKTKTIILSSHKAESNEDLFTKAFLELILKRVFEQELMSQPK